jgi:hypothetical protein
MEPQELPGEYVALNEWLEGQDTNGKMIFYPDPVEWGSARPTINYRPVDKQPKYYGIYWQYLENSLREGDTLRFGELISPYNAEEFVVRTEMIQPEEATEVISLLSEQEDMAPAEQFGPLYVFENQSHSYQIHPAGQSLVVSGGLQNITSLTPIDSYHMTSSPIVFIDQLMTNSDYISVADILVSSQGSLDLCLSLIEDRHLVKPFASSKHSAPNRYWSKGTTNDTPGLSWHRYLDKRGIENWQSDYGEGLVFTWAADSLDIPFKVTSGEEYDLLVRYFQNQDGGSMRIQVDGQPVGEITTISQINQFLWQEVGTLNLGQGKHTITLENVKGFNTVNLLAVLPHGELESYKKQARHLIQDKRIIHIWEAESALNYSREGVSSKHDTQTTNGEELTLSEGSKAWREIDILKAGNYNLAVRLEGKAVVSVDERNFRVGADSLSFIYLDLLYLDEGKHSIQMKPADAESTYVDVIWLYSAEGEETIEDIFADGENSAQLIAYNKINPTKYRVSVNASDPFMLTFAEAYDPLWVAKVNGRECQSVPLNSVVNGFWIEDSGELEVTIEYKSQRWFYYGACLTLVSLVAVLGYLVWERMRGKNIGRR